MINNSILQILRFPVNIITLIDAAVKFKNCLIGSQNAVDVQLSLVDHLQELLTKFDLFVLVATIKGVVEVRMVRPIALLPQHISLSFVTRQVICIVLKMISESSGDIKATNLI